MTLDVCAFIIIVVSAILYFVSKRKAFFLFTAGIGTGMVIGAIWFSYALQNAFR